jgi:hypothetical protein
MRIIADRSGGRQEYSWDKNNQKRFIFETLRFTSVAPPNELTRAAQIMFG